MREQQFEYDVQKRARAGTAATLRAVISLYIEKWQLPGSRLGRLAGGDCIYCGGDCLWRVYMENLAS